MSYTTNRLVSDAFFSSGIVSRDFETVSGPQIDLGIQLTNELLSEKVADKGMIPYETVQDFTAIPGQEDYFIDDLIKVDTLTYDKNDVRYPVVYGGRDSYQGDFRTNKIESLPYTYFMEREFGGARIYLYYLPDEAYVFTINGIFRLKSISIGQDLEKTLEPFYITYLRYDLTIRICQQYYVDVPPYVERGYQKITAKIDKQLRPMDLSMTKQSTMQKGGGINYAVANLGEGWNI